MHCKLSNLFHVLTAALFRYTLALRDTVLTLSNIVPKLMYGFGDDKHVSNDTVNVMEEILIEYIVDVVRNLHREINTPLMHNST